MQRVLKIIVFCLIILVSTLILDLFNVIIFYKPLLYIKEDNIYKGLIINSYVCSDQSKLQIKSKFNKFSCPIAVKKKAEDKDVENKKVNYSLDLVSSNVCTDQLILYYDGIDRDIYFNCVGEFYIYNEYNRYTLNDFIVNNISSLDDVLNNYYGYSYDGDNVLYKISFGVSEFNIYKCNNINNRNIYVSTSEMNFICN